MSNNSCPLPRKVIEVEDTWVNIRATMDRRVMPAEMFPRVKFDCTRATKNRCSKWRNYQSKSAEGVHRCIKFRRSSVVKPLVSMRKVVQAGNVVVLDEKNPHIRINRDDTVIKLDVKSGVYTVDMWGVS